MGTQRLSHVAVTVPRDYFKPDLRAELLGFYGTVFGWTENPRLAIPEERIFLRAPTDEQYVTIRASDDPMRTSGYEHMGIAVGSVEELREIHERAAALASEDPRVVLDDIKAGYGGLLHGFRVRFLLPLTIEVQFLQSPKGTLPKVR